VTILQLYMRQSLTRAGKTKGWESLEPIHRGRHPQTRDPGWLPGKLSSIDIVGDASEFPIGCRVVGAMGAPEELRARRTVMAAPISEGPGGGQRRRIYDHAMYSRRQSS